MMRTINIALILASLTMAFGLYRVKYDAAASVRQIAALRAGIAREKDTIDILRAEWSHLNHPERVERLAKKFLGLEMLGADQILRMNELPEGPVPAGDPYGNRPTIGDFMRDLALTDGEQQGGTQ